MGRWQQESLSLPRCSYLFVVVVKDGRDWMTAAKNMGKWHQGVERGAEALDSAWRRADLRQSNVQPQREVSEVVQ